MINKLLLFIFLFPPSISGLTWVETTQEDFADGVYERNLYASHRYGGTVEFAHRFDLNNDGYLEVFTSSWDNLRVFWGQSDGFDPGNYREFSVSSRSGNSISSDLNCNGYPELITKTSSHLLIHWGQPGGPVPGNSFSISTPWTVGEASYTADLNKDGWLDIIVDRYNYSVSAIFWGDSSGYSESNRTELPMYVGCQNIEVGDFNNDNWLDILFCERDLSWLHNRIYWGSPSGYSASNQQALPTAYGVHGTSVADLNNDGYLDLVFTHWDSNVTYIYWGSSSGYSQTNMQILNSGPAYGGSACADINEDGYIDILFFRSNAIPIIYWGNETGFSDGNTTTVGICDVSTGGCIADFNYDSHLDFLLNGYYSYSYVHWGPDFNGYVSLPVSCDHHGMFFEPGNVYTREYKEDYISSVFDGGEIQLWLNISWDDSIPSGTDIIISVRTGETSSPDSTWREWVPVSNGGIIPDSLASRYIQYKAIFTYTTPAILPYLWEVRIEYGAINQLLVEPDYIDSTGTGQMKTYSIYVENQGTTEDIVEITKQWTELNWDVRIRDAISGDTLIDHNGNGIPDIDTLFPNETRYLFVDITPTDSCFAGTTDTTVIKAYFASDTATSDTCFIITKIIMDISLIIDPDQSGNILPGESINYSLDITNYGNIKDVVDVTVTQSSPSWSYDLLDSTGISLVDHNGNWAVDIDTLEPFGTSCGIVAQISSPASANPGDVDTALVLVRFTGYPDTVDTATLITTVISPDSTLVLIDPDQTGYVDAGLTKVYNLTVRNLGSLDDVIDIISNGTSPGWSCSLLDSSGNPLTDTDGDSKVDVGLVPSGGSVLMKAGITSSIAAQGGDIDSTVIWAVSSIDTSVKDNAHLVTIVNSSVAVLIEPDSADSVSPGDTVSYNLAVTNLGNSPDVIDITSSGGNADWYFEILDENGLPLEDTDSDGKLDVGPVLPNSSVNIRARVGASDSAVAGDTDIRVVYATSSNNENIYDTAMLITYITGSVTLFLIDPDYSERLEFGMVKDYALWVVLEGTARDYVEVYPAGASGGWTYELLNSGLSPLIDNNSNGMFDIGWMEPNDTVGLYIRVNAPTGMVGLDSLSLKVVINGETEVYSKEDSAVVYSYIVPALEIHNYASPFMDRTTFRFSLPEAGKVYLNVYNRLGERVRVLLSGKHYQRGIYKLPWDGRNDYSKPLAPAVYYYVFRLKRDSGREDKIIKKTAIVR